MTDSRSIQLTTSNSIHKDFLKVPAGGQENDKGSAVKAIGCLRCPCSVVGPSPPAMTPQGHSTLLRKIASLCPVGDNLFLQAGCGEKGRGRGTRD